MSAADRERILTEILESQQRCLRWLQSQVGVEAEEILQQAALAVLELLRGDRVAAIQSPEAYGIGIVRNCVYHHIRDAARERKYTKALAEVFQLQSPAPNPEELLLAQERRGAVVAIDDARSAAGREVLRRAYLEGEAPRLTQARMGLNPTQYRLLKSRAKAQLAKASARRRRLAALANVTTAKIPNAA